jgi:hypothetical protein
MIVDSSATIGEPAVNASATSVDKSSNDFALMPIALVSLAGLAASA